MLVFQKYGFILLIILKVFTLKCNGDRTKDRMYIDIKASTSCFRRLNATHQVGCSSSRGGTSGVAHFCTSGYDILFILKNGTAGPYIPIIPVGLLSEKAVKTLKSSHKISGLLLYNSNETMSSFTHDLQCPNENFAVENTCGKNTDNIIWNPSGTGLLFEDISFPVFYLDSPEEVQSIKDCFNKFNNYSFESQRDRSLCSLQLNSFMYGATNTPTCIRRSNIVTNLNPVRVCDPLGDKNIWATLFPLAEYNNSAGELKPILGQKYIVIAARTDTASLFDRTSGADSPVTGLVTLLTVAKLLKEMLPENKLYGTNVLFILFNGETFDYIGSQRIVYDMEKGNFPVLTENGTAVYVPVIRAKDISLFIELSQLSSGREGTVFVHRYRVDDKITKFTNLLKSNLAFPKQIETSDGTLPPSSANTFLRKFKDLSTVILTNHKNAYFNQFYNSIFDNSTNIKYKYANKSSDQFESEGDGVQKHLLDVATAISKSVYNEITGNSYDGNLTDQFELVDELLHCYLEDPNCKIYKAVGKQPKKQDRPLNLYVGVDVNMNEATKLLGLILGWLLGDVVGDSNENCTNTNISLMNSGFRHYNMSVSIHDLNTTKCYSMVMNFTEAVSPAFIIDDYDWSSNLYSSWSESTWGDISMRLFLKPSAAHESMTIAIGCISLIFSFLLVYFIKSRSHILFTPESVQPSPVDC